MRGYNDKPEFGKQGKLTHERGNFNSTNCLNHMTKTEQLLEKKNAALKKELAAKNHELEIEAALERVRARTMAMQRSDELKETTLVLNQQLKELGATTAQVSICIFDEEIKNGEMFLTLNGEKIDRSFKMELDKEVFVMQK